MQTADLKEQEKTYAEEKRKVQHRIAEIRSQRMAIIRLDDKIAENGNKIYSLKSEVAQVGERVFYFACVKRLHLCCLGRVKEGGSLDEEAKESDYEVRQTRLLMTGKLSYHTDILHLCITTGKRSR